jgi:hypothetical protein
MELLMVEQDECARRQGRDDQERQMGLMGFLKRVNWMLWYRLDRS